MPTLKQTLQDQDIGFLRAVSDAWRIEAELPDPRTGRNNLALALLNASLVAEVCAALPAEARAALGELRRAGGRLRLDAFTRQYGGLRDMGPARRDREQPHINPASTTERLYFHALIGRAFFADDSERSAEYAFIPDDLLPLLPVFEPGGLPNLGRPASPDERKQVTAATDHILDDACSLLAALRGGESSEHIDSMAVGEEWSLPPHVLIALLEAAGLLDEKGQPAPDATRTFLESQRAVALSQLVAAWRSSETFNELRLLAGLAAEGTWSNQPRAAREQVLRLLGDPSNDLWLAVNAWIEDLHRQQPDFQRAGAEYETWYLRDAATGAFLRGEAHWMAVEGTLLRFFLTRLLPALGILDRGSPKSKEGAAPVAAFRFSRLAPALLRGEVPGGLPEESGQLTATAGLQIDVPRSVPRAVRYQVARFSEWRGLRRGGYRYQVTPASLENATSQGLKIEHLITLLNGHHNGPLPPGVPRTLQRWAAQGTQARIESVIVLRVTHPEILEQLRASRAARFLGTPLGPTTVTIQPGARDKIVAALAELGVLSDIVLDDDSSTD